MTNKTSWRNHTSFHAESCEIDECLYRILDANGSCAGIMSTHVDDFLLTGSPSCMEAVDFMLTSRFDRLETKLSPFVHCGVRICQQPNFSVSADQEDYLRGLKAIPTTSEDWSRRQEDLPEDLPPPLRALLGQLSYAATCSRPDLCSSLADISTRINELRMHDRY